MKNANARNANDNEDPFQSLGLITEKLLNSNKNKNEDARDDGERSDGDEKKQQTQLEYVKQRLRDLAEFEERARGRWKRPRRGA